MKNASTAEANGVREERYRVGAYRQLTDDALLLVEWLITVSQPIEWVKQHAAEICAQAARTRAGAMAPDGRPIVAMHVEAA